jgi:dihydrofolate reductase
MRTLSVFESVSLDGYFTDRNREIGWAHKQDDEWNEFVGANASGNGELVFGRVTYEMMVKFWPTEEAKKANAKVADGMNRSRKVVVSKTLEKPAWENTRRIAGDLPAEMRKLKEQDGGGLVILGSGTLVAQLTEAGLIDAYQIVVWPVVLGGGRTLFEGVSRPVNLVLKRTKSFRNGNVVLWYERA